MKGPDSITDSLFKINSWSLGTAADIKGAKRLDVGKGGQNPKIFKVEKI